METTASPATAIAISAKSAAVANDDPPGGLTSDEARRRLQTSGLNAMPDTSMHPVRMAVGKFWAPVPWMLEAAVALEIVLGDWFKLRSSRAF